jgi:hypothetical protein
MWCRDCHREVDVKAAGSACPLCGRALTTSTRQTDDIRRAYEILERWQSSDLFERISTTAPLTTFKQQDRAPLLNIPLGRPAVAAAINDAESVVPPVSTVSPESTAPPETVNAQKAVPVQEPPTERRSNTLPPMPASLRVPRELLAPAREFVGVPTNPTGTSRKEQLVWDLLVSPTPLMANVLPQSSSQLPLSSAAVVPPALVAGVSERPLPGVKPETTQSPPTVIFRDAEPAVMESAVGRESASTAKPDTLDDHSAEMQLASVDAAHADRAESVAPEGVEHKIDSHEIDQTYTQSITTEDESPWDPQPDAATIASEDRVELETDDSAQYELNDPQSDDVDDFSTPAAVDDLSHLENLFADLAKDESSQESAEEEDRFRETRSSDGASVRETAEQIAASAEVSQTILPVLMSSASVHEEPATLEFKSADLPTTPNKHTLRRRIKLSALPFVDRPCIAVFSSNAPFPKVQQDQKP